MVLCCYVWTKCLARSPSSKANIIVFLQLYKSGNIERKLLKFRRILPKFYTHQVEVLARGHCIGHENSVGWDESCVIWGSQKVSPCSVDAMNFGKAAGKR